MKVFRMLLAMLIFAGLAVAVLAQKRLTSNHATAPTNPAPAAGFAIVDSGEFGDEKTGIAKVTATLAQLRVKYQGVNKELTDMQARLTSLRTDIQNKRLVQDPKTTAQQTEQADKLEVDIKRKAEDAEAASQREASAALAPLQADIQKALDAYAKAHGILLVIDANRVPLVYADASIDITKDFIADYNKTHPATPAAPVRP